MDEADDPIVRAGQLVTDYRNSRDLALLDRAEFTLRPLAGPDGRNASTRITALVVLSQVVALRGRESGQPADLDEAVDLTRTAVALVPAGDPLWPAVYSQACWVWCQRHEATGRLADLHEAVRYGEAAVADAAPENLDRVGALSNLGLAYRLSFTRSGRLADLDNAVRLVRTAAVEADDQDDRLTSRGLLAVCLISRFTAVGRMADIDEAVDLLRGLQAEMPAPHVEWVAVATNLALALWQRHFRGGSAGDLVEATRISQEVVGALPANRRLRSLFLANHAVVQFGHFLSADLDSDRGDTIGRVEQAVRSAREAVDTAADDDPRLAIHRANLANLLLVRARLVSDPSGVEQAVQTGRAALAGLSPGSPDRARALGVLATAMRVRHMISREPADLDAAIGLWRSATSSPVGPIEVRMSAATAWARAAVQERDAELALEAYSAAVGLLPVLAWRGLDRPVQEQRLARVVGLGSEAAAWALAAGRPRRAVELLEHGRQMLWSQAVQTRSDLSALAAVAPDLAARLDETRRELDGGGAGQSAGQVGPRARNPGWEVELDLVTVTAGTTDGPPGDTAGQRRLAERWERLLAEARRQPGFATFLTAPTFESLRRGAAGGPVVLLNTTEWRSDALVVTPTEVHPVPLPWLDHDTAQDRAAALLAAQREVETRRSPVARTHLRQTLTSIQRWLWDTIGEPVCAALDDILDADGWPPAATAGQPDSRPRVWWCPTGSLTMLPLHAAGRYGAGPALADRRRPTVAARFVSSYTSSLAALSRARSGPAPARPPRVFAVGLAHTPGQAPLPAVTDELRAVSTNLSGVRLLSGPGATTGAVLAALAQHSWAHFACHAQQDFDNPSASALRLADGPLSVLDLASRLSPANGSGADLAYLSACRTAAGGRALPDEAIHLTAALQFAGYRHVIGSQWAVADRIAAQVADDVYAQLGAGGDPDADRAAYALDHALARVRAQNPERPELWAALIHTGP